jgi:chitodextrinase
VKGYRVFRNGVYVRLTTSTSFSDAGLAPSTQYCYTVDAFDYGYNRSSLSAQACTTTLPSSGPAPAAPSNLTVIAVTSDSITLSWVDNSADESGFQIERAPSTNGPWVTVGTGGANVDSYTDIGLSPATAYYYRVSAFN